MHVTVAFAGALLFLAAWVSTLRTVFAPTGRASLISRATAFAVGATVLAIARRLPEPGREYLLGCCSPLMLLLMAVTWLIGSIAGVTLFAWGLSQVSLNAQAIGGFYALRSANLVLPAVAWLSSALLLAAFTAHLVHFTSAYSRRELLVGRLSVQATRAPDAETIFAGYAHAGDSDRLGTLFGEWSNWFADVQATHLAYPALVHYRSGGTTCWAEAAQIMLDCAALTEACAPNWAPPETSSLLTAGGRCLPRVAACLGIALPPVQVSYQGRETYPFSCSLAKIRTAGLMIEMDDERAQSAFQQLRIRYAPFATAICERLLYLYGDMGQ
jgi:hypothetical protein